MAMESMAMGVGGGGGGGRTNIMSYMGVCCCEGYGFQALMSRIEYRNQTVVSG